MVLQRKKRMWGVNVKKRAKQQNVLSRGCLCDTMIKGIPQTKLLCALWGKARGRVCEKKLGMFPAFAFPDIAFVFPCHKTLRAKKPVHTCVI